MFKWFFKEKNKKEAEVLCAMCKLYKPIPTRDMGDEFCFLCIVKRGREALGLSDFQPERSKREDCEKCIILKRGDTNDINSCCYEEISQMRCSEHCGNTVRDK